jgi:hypothetical protein
MAVVNLQMRLMSMPDRVESRGNEKREGQGTKTRCHKEKQQFGPGQPRDEHLRRVSEEPGEGHDDEADGQCVAPVGKAASAVASCQGKADHSIASGNQL